MKIPNALHLLFESFPLKTYSSSKGDGTLATENPSYNFVRREPPTSDENEKSLAVHNIRKIELNNGTTRFIPTDPNGLLAAVLLCDQHNLMLPQETIEQNPGPALVPLSYLASNDGELPILIEKEKNPDFRVKVTSSHDLLQTYRATVSGHLTAVFDDFLCSLDDLWVLILLTRLPRDNPKAVNKLFHSDFEFEKNDLLYTHLVSRLLSDMSSWKAFTVRHPNISLGSKLAPKTIKDFLWQSSGSRDVLNRLYSSKLSEFERSVPLFMSSLASGDLKDAKPYFRLKFTSYVVCIEHLISSGLDLQFSCSSPFHDAFEYSKQALLEF